MRWLTRSTRSRPNDRRPRSERPERPSPRRPRAGEDLSLYPLAAGRLPLPPSADLLGIRRRGARPLWPVGGLVDDARAALALPPMGHLRHRPRARHGAARGVLVRPLAVRALAITLLL